MTDNEITHAGNHNQFERSDLRAEELAQDLLSAIGELFVTDGKFAELGVRCAELPAKPRPFSIYTLELFEGRSHINLHYWVNGEQKIDYHFAETPGQLERQRNSKHVFLFKDN